MKHLMTKWLALFLSFVVIASSTAAFAQATIFVRPTSGYAWWTQGPAFLPQSKADGGITVKGIDDWINANRGMKLKSSTCFMSFVQDEQVVSPDRATHNDIRARLARYPNSFDQYFEGAPGHVFRVRVGVFEACQPPDTTTEPLRYMAVVVTDSQNRVREFDALHWHFIRLFKNSDGKINAWGCYECGEVTQLNWDSGNDKFYWEWIGH